MISSTIIKNYLDEKNYEDAVGYSRCKLKYMSNEERVQAAPKVINQVSLLVCLSNIHVHASPFPVCILLIQQFG